MDVDIPLSRDLCCTTGLHPYDDGLGDSRPKNLKLRFSQIKADERTQTMLKTDLNNDNSKKRITAPDEPTAQEVVQGGSLECRGVWVGWYLPFEDLQFNRKVHKGLSVKRLCEGDGADSQIAAARAIAPPRRP